MEDIRCGWRSLRGSITSPTLEAAGLGKAAPESQWANPRQLMVLCSAFGNRKPDVKFRGP